MKTQLVSLGQLQKQFLNLLNVKNSMQLFLTILLAINKTSPGNVLLHITTQILYSWVVPTDL